MSLTTPSKIRELQIKLYRKAKNEPEYRFYMLYDEVYREDVLGHAYARARANKGAAGVDGQTFEGIETAGLGEWLTGIGEELRNMTYAPLPVRRVIIPKPGGGERPLGIPTIRDRVLQTAAKLLIEPIFEADLEPNAYGYRPKRSAQDAIQQVHELLCEGRRRREPADSRYSDAITLDGILADATIVTTDEVLSEFLTFFAQDAWLRSRAARTVQELLKDPNVLVVPQSRGESFLDGLEFCQQRPDKEYSLIDCISMQTMRRHGVAEALTDDRHFEQEGFRALFRDP